MTSLHQSPKPQAATGLAPESDQARLRLEHLYELSQLFASFDQVEDTFDPAVAIAARTLPLRSAIMIEANGDRSKMTVWPSEGQSPQQMRAARANIEAAYTYLIGAAPTDLNLSEEAGKTLLPRQTGAEGTQANRFIIIPLVVARRPPFGALQLEGGRPLDKMDLKFVNAIANQLAVALERDRSWGRDISLRKDAEERRGQAERRGATAERDRLLANSSKNEYQALAEENASLYEEARQAVAVREQILAIVSHDLRNPLGTILMATAMLEEDAASPVRAADVVSSAGKIKRSANRMLRLIEDLLDFASIGVGQLAIRRELEDPGSMIRETLTTFEAAAQQKGLLLTADVAPLLARSSCDRDRILQVLSNLVGNALKVTDSGGTIALKVALKGAELVFAVADTGPGISDADAKHLFERYWRSDQANYRGTGLGLAIAQGIVSAHGGRIWVETALGRGSTFCFSLPLAHALS